MVLLLSSTAGVRLIACPAARQDRLVEIPIDSNSVFFRGFPTNLLCSPVPKSIRQTPVPRPPDCRAGTPTPARFPPPRSGLVFRPQATITLVSMAVVIQTPPAITHRAVLATIAQSPSGPAQSLDCQFLDTWKTCSGCALEVLSLQRRRPRTSTCPRHGPRAPSEFPGGS